MALSGLSFVEVGVSFWGFYIIRDPDPFSSHLSGSGCSGQLSPSHVFLGFPSSTNYSHIKWMALSMAVLVQMCHIIIPFQSSFLTLFNSFYTQFFTQHLPPNSFIQSHCTLSMVISFLFQSSASKAIVLLSYSNAILKQASSAFHSQGKHFCC